MGSTIMGERLVAALGEGSLIVVEWLRMGMGDISCEEGAEEPPLSHAATAPTDRKEGRR